LTANALTLFGGERRPKSAQLWSNGSLCASQNRVGAFNEDARKPALSTTTF